MFKEKTIYRWEIEGTGYFVEKELTKDPDGETLYNYWIGHKDYGTKKYAFGQMEEINESILFDTLFDELILYKQEVIDADYM